MDSETQRRPSPPASGNETNSETLIRPLPNFSPAGQEGTTGQQGSEPNAISHAVGNALGTVAGKSGRFRTRGRRRKMPQSLGRYPFPVAAKRYLAALLDHRAKATLAQLQRDLKTIGEDVQALCGQGKLSSSNPYLMTLDDLAHILGYWRTRPKRGKNPEGPLDPTTQANLWKNFRGLLEFCGNGAVGQLKTRPYVKIPKAIEKPIQTLSPQQLAAMRLATEAMPNWWGAVARFLTRFCPDSGLRPKEVRLQDLPCIEMENQLVLVCHPKGEGKWAAPHSEYAPIGEVGSLALRDFLTEREKFLDGQPHEALIPYRHSDGRLDYWSDAMMRKLKKQIEQASGVKFKIKTFRATFGQLANDNGASIEAVSRAMRHRSTKTTEKYYARVRPDKALNEVREALKRIR